MKRTIGGILTIIILVSVMRFYFSYYMPTRVIFDGSEYFSQEDVEAAADVVKEFFDENWDKCNLTKLRYKGDDVMENNASLLRIHGADEIMIFESSIYISPFYDKGIFVRNSTIKWSWTLVRKDGGQWEIISFGGG